MLRACRTAAKSIAEGAGYGRVSAQLSCGLVRARPAGIKPAAEIEKDPPLSRQVLDFLGGPSGARTRDQRIMSLTEKPFHHVDAN